MTENDTVKAILARKKAGIERMCARQQRVQTRLAEYVETHPEVINDGLTRVREQLARPLCKAQEINKEWERILCLRSATYVAAILRDTSSTTEQLRACAPFTLV
jgi:hypothetical protein